MATETTELGDAAVSACVDAGGSAVGMPALCGDWFANQIFWLCVALVVTLPDPQPGRASAHRGGSGRAAGDDHERYRGGRGAETSCGQGRRERHTKKRWPTPAPKRTASPTRTKAEMQKEVDAAMADADARNRQADRSLRGADRRDTRWCRRGGRRSRARYGESGRLRTWH